MQPFGERPGAAPGISDLPTDEANLKRRVNHLANERLAMFELSSTNSGLSDAQQQRLTAIERQLDECFLARRRLRAARDVERFSRDLLPRRMSTEK